MGNLTFIQAGGALLVVFCLLYIQILGTTILYRWTKSSLEYKEMTVKDVLSIWVTETQSIPPIMILGLTMLYFG